MPRALPTDTLQEYAVTRAPEVDVSTITRTRDGVKLNIELHKQFLEETAKTMNDRFEATGDLYPLVIGHTIDGAAEHDQPQKVGFRHNFRVEMFEGRPALASDHYIKKHQTVVIQGAPVKLSASEIAEKFPRRSGEIWINRHEIDPHCLLGATAPERPLGVLRFSADGQLSSVPYTSPGVLKMAKEDEKVTGENLHDLPGMKELGSLVAELKGLIADFKPIMEALTAGMPKPGEEGPAGGEGESSEDIQKLLAELGQSGGGEEEPAPTGAQSEPVSAAVKPDEKAEKLARDNADMKVQLARHELTTKLNKAKDDGRAIDPNDRVLVADLLALPSDLQDRMISRFPARVGTQAKSVEEKLKLSREPGDKKKVATAEDAKSLIEYASKKGVDHAGAKEALGFE